MPGDGESAAPKEPAAVTEKSQPQDTSDEVNKSNGPASLEVKSEVDEFGLPIRKGRKSYASSNEDLDGATAPSSETNGVSAEKNSSTNDLNAEKPGGSETQGQSGTESPEVDAGLQDKADILADQEKKDAEKRLSKQSQRDSQALTAAAVSEWSHQQLTLPTQEEDDHDHDEQWQSMPAYASYDMYDDDGKLVAHEILSDGDDDQTMHYGALGGAGKGYTRVQLDEDAQSATSLDDNTAYLFKEKGTGVVDEDEEARDPLAQMQATKDLLTEGQRIAYVGLTRLAIAQMAKDLDSAEGSRGTKKATDVARDSLRMWGQKMMVRLYGHMDIDSAEQVMIEQLAEHGVQPGDLSPALMQNAHVKNPVAEQEDSKSTSSAIGTPVPDTKDAEATSTFRSPKPDPKAAKSGQPSPNPEDDVDEPLPPYSPTEGVPSLQDPSEIREQKTLDIDLRWTVLCDLFLVLIADSIYDSRSRQLMEHVGSYLQVSWLEICQFEKRIIEALEMQESANKENWNEDEHIESRRKRDKRRRLAMMGLATVGGGLVIGLSAGLLAPLIGAGLAAGFTTIGVAGTSTFFAGAGGAAIITTTGLVTGGTIGIRASDRRTGAVKTFEYRPLHNNKRVNLIVTVAGWMNGKVDDVRLPFSTIDPTMGDIYSVHWEPEMLQSMGQTINILATEALTQGLQQVLGSTILISLMAALQLPIVLTKLSYLIDNPWTVSLARAELAGLILADSLIDRNLGTRPITLVGFSLGARVIFSCLRELSRKGAYGLVQNAYLFGSPMVADKDDYLRAKSVVTGRFVNGYATNDWILGYLFRATSGGIRRVAGLAEVNVKGIENVDVTETVAGHMAYRAAMPKLLRQMGWMIESDEFTEIEDPDPDNHEKRQRELINEIEEARKDIETGKKSKWRFGLFKREKLAEKKEWETYDDRLKEGLDSKAAEDILDKEGNVLFDIEAIRAEAAELAAQGFEIKQLESTMPPMKVDLASADSSPVPPPLKMSKSFDDRLSPPSQHPTRTSPVGLGLSSPDLPIDRNDAHLGGSRDIHDVPAHHDAEYHTSPELSYQKSPGTASAHSGHGWNNSEEVGKPRLQSHRSSPAHTGPETNAWADDDDEFRTHDDEEEVSMTFE